MPFRTQYIQTDGSLNVDGSIFLRQVPLSTGVSLSGINIASYVNSSSYYDASIMNRYLPNPSTAVVQGNPLGAQGIFVTLTTTSQIVIATGARIGIDGKAAAADPDASTSMPAVALNPANAAYNDGETKPYLTFGVYRQSGQGLGLVTGKQVFLKADGRLTTICPSIAGQCIQVVGIATSADSIIWNPSPDFVILK
jgi:hypothetical protein